MLDNINEIRCWIKMYTNLSDEEFQIIEKNKQLIVNTFTDIKITYDENIGVPIKFGTIDGSFFMDFRDPLNYTKILSLDFLPKVIKGNLNMPGAPLTQESFKNWDTIYIKTSINFCGIKTSIVDFNFLENTDFEKIYLRLANTPFKNNIIPNDYKKHLGVFSDTLTKEKLMEIIVNKDIVLDYFDFGNHLEINKDK